MHNLPIKEENRNPKISIGLVVYNGVEHIRGALDSIVRLSYKNIELIVVDGASNDGMLDVLNDYTAHISVLVSEPDKGIYDAMNKVCSLATGDWLIFLGCDDQLLDTLGNITKLMTYPDAVYYGDVIVRSSGKNFGGKFSKIRYLQENICHQSMFYPRAVYQKYFYSLSYLLLADYLYNLTLLGLGIRFVYTGVVVSLFNDKGRHTSGDADFKRDHINLIAATLGHEYAMVEIARRYVYRYVRPTIKLLALYPFWKYCWSQLRIKKRQ